MPETNHVLAVDTAEGGNDYYVCDNITGEQVAVYHSNQNSNMRYGLAYTTTLLPGGQHSWPVKAFLMTIQICTGECHRVTRRMSDERTGMDSEPVRRTGS